MGSGLTRFGPIALRIVRVAKPAMLISNIIKPEPRRSAMHLPKVSVVIPAYNAEQFLPECLHSLFELSFQDYEIVIVNDSSMDNTASILQECQHHEKISLVSFSRHLGEAASMNAAIAVARGHYIARMDADDIALEGRLSLPVEALDDDAELMVVGAQMHLFGHGFNHVSLLPEDDAEIKSALLTGVGHLATSAVMWRRDWFIQQGLAWNTSLPGARDLRFWCDAMLAGAKFRNLSQTLVRHRIHDSHTSRQADTMRRSVGSNRAMLIEALYPTLSERSISHLLPVLEIPQFGAEHLTNLLLLKETEQTLLQMREESTALFGENRAVLRRYIEQCLVHTAERIKTLSARLVHGNTV